MTTPHDDHTAEPVDEPAAAESAAQAASVGDSRVDAALARLEDLRDRPVGEHVGVYDDIHGRLRQALEEAAVDPASQPHG
ncbi:MAG: hypothetical protein M3165_03400 [Actinomycetota bacterium]|nr:hypothetical protein [Actinomycetota bacterium]